MKFLYDENKEYAETQTLFSQEEIKAHIDRSFQAKRTYFQSIMDREALSPRQGVGLMLVSIGLLAAGLWSRPPEIAESVLRSGLSCVMLAAGCVLLCLGLMALVQAFQHSADEAQMHKGKGKGKPRQLHMPNGPRDLAYQELLGRGKLYQGRIAQITELEPPLREIRFHFSPDGTQIVSGAFITESSADLPPYETLVVLSNGEVTVLL